MESGVLSAFKHILREMKQALLANLILTCLVCAGCQETLTPTAACPEYLRSFDADLLVQRGNLFFVTDVRAGRSLAMRLGKPCLLFFTAEWCTYCHRMVEETFTDPQIGALGEKFVCIWVDADQHAQLCNDYSIAGFPTVQFLSPENRELHRLKGWQSPQSLAAGMLSALERFAWITSLRGSREY